MQFLLPSPCLPFTFQQASYSQTSAAAAGPGPGGPPPQAAYYYPAYPAQHQPTRIVYAQPQPVYIETVPVVGGELPHKPIAVVCPHCGRSVVSVIQRERPSGIAWVSCVLLAITFLWPLCLVPFCIPGCYDTQHSCPNCGYYLGGSDSC